MEKLILAVVLGLVGLVPLGVVLSRMRRNRDLRADGIRTHAVVSEVLTGMNDGMQTITLTYGPADGANWAPIARRTMMGGGPYQVGQKIEIIYDRADPHRMIYGWKHNYTVVLVLLGIVAMAFIAFAVRIALT